MWFNYFGFSLNAFQDLTRKRLLKYCTWEQRNSSILWFRLWSNAYVQTLKEKWRVHCSLNVNTEYPGLGFNMFSIIIFTPNESLLHVWDDIEDGVLWPLQLFTLFSHYLVFTMLLYRCGLFTDVHNYVVYIVFLFISLWTRWFTVHEFMQQGKSRKPGSHKSCAKSTPYLHGMRCKVKLSAGAEVAALLILERIYWPQ